MDLITWILLGLALFVSALLLVKRSSAGYKLPPGPRGLPLLGCLWAMRQEFHILFADLAKTWGDITSINIMGKTIVSLNSADIVREAFCSQEFGGIFSGRDLPPALHEWIIEMTSFMQPGPVLSKQRKLVHKILNHYGEGVLEAERMIQGELTHVIDYLERAGESVDMDEVIYNSLINVIGILLTGRRHDYDSPVLENVREFEETGAPVSSPLTSLLFYLLPVMKRVPVGPGKLAQRQKNASIQLLKDYYEECRLTGRRHDYDSPVLENVREFEETGAPVSSQLISLLFYLLPVMKRVPVGPGKLAQRQKNASIQLLKDYYEECRATYKSRETRGMIDFLIRHQEELRLETGSSWLQDRHIEAIVLEMIGAGVITTRGALYFFFLIIAHHPEVATKIQAEIEAVVGGSRRPKLDDRSAMPYTMAAMFELLRYISHVPTGLTHRITDDVTFHGYFIPKNTTVIYNLWGINHDEKIWPEPWTFRPERFLGDDRKLIPADHPNRKNAIPFGIGRRSCVGEAFAKSRMFLFITTLLQRFNFSADPARPLRSCDPRTYRAGVVLSPFPFWLKVTPRS